MRTGEHHPYIQAAIDGEIARVANATEGERNETLFKAAASLASLGLLEGEIIRYLKPAAESTGLRGKEFYSTVKSGVKRGSANPRTVPGSSRPPPHIMAPRPSTMIKLPERSFPDPKGDRPAFFVGGDAGPSASGDEIRRHIYRRGGKSVRMKIKRVSGYASWYRAVDGDREGWQAGKPDGYVPCPYVGAIDPFDPQCADSTVYWPEGEKDCDTLAQAGLRALTFGGTGDGLPEGASEYLRNRHVVIVADNDTGGQQHALRKAAVAYPVARTVKLVQFPELPPKGDVSDYLKLASISDLEARASATPLWMPPANSPESGWRSSAITASNLKTKIFSPVKYVVPGYIPEGVTIFAGKPKIGKSWLLYDLCLACAADRFVLGQIKPIQGDVLYLALEDSERRLKKRLQKLWPDGDWPAQLTLTTSWRKADAGGLDDIDEWCESAARPVLIVVDTLEKFFAKIHAAAYTTDYLAIAGLHKLAHARGIAIVVIHHVRKLEADDPFDMVSGTNGLTGAADTILVLKRQAGNATLHARGRDIEEKETACRFDKMTCRWTLLGDADQVHSSGERAAIISALANGGSEGMHISEIMAATERNDRNAVDQLLFKMQRDRELVRIKRGLYALPGKIGKKERNEAHPSGK
jgi:hypothetical protein